MSERISTSTGVEQAPIWFIAHGGPTMVENTTHPAYRHWQTIAREIDQNAANIRGIVFISAHWQADPAMVENDPRGIVMNVDQRPGLLYDYYNFPSRFYQLQFPTHNPLWLTTQVKDALENQSFSVTPTLRGLDHGVFIPLIAGWGQSGRASFPPLVQISLPPEDDNGDATKDGINALRLGRALSRLRQAGIAIIGGGQPVHNLIDFRRRRSGIFDGPFPYSARFLKEVHMAMIAPGQGLDEISKEPKRWNGAKELLRSPFFRQAHPTNEHFLPLLVCFGAAEEHEVGEEQFALDEGPLGWHMYRWG